MTDLSKRNRANKKKGSTWQSDLRSAIDPYFPVEILTLAGQKDEGDLAVQILPDLIAIIEAKAERSYDLPGYTREAIREGINYEARRVHHLSPSGFVLPMWAVKQPRANTLAAHVGIDLETTINFWQWLHARTW